MAKVTLRYFASVREALGKSDEKADVEGDRVIHVLRWLADHHGDKLVPTVLDTDGTLREEYRLLHNGAVCSSSSMRRVKISDGDEVVIMPPVAGG